MCGLTQFTRAVSCNKQIIGDQTVNALVEQRFEHHAAPKDLHSDKDGSIQSDNRLYKLVLDALNVHVTTSVPYTHTSNPLCERQNRVVDQNLRILMKQERTKAWIHLLPWAVLTMNSRESYSNGYTPKELFHGGAYCMVFQNPFPCGLHEPCRGLAGTQAGPGQHS